jgi:hypothetical protein
MELGRTAALASNLRLGVSLGAVPLRGRSGNSDADYRVSRPTAVPLARNASLPRLLV